MSVTFRGTRTLAFSGISNAGCEFCRYSGDVGDQFSANLSSGEIGRVYHGQMMIVVERIVLSSAEPPTFDFHISYIWIGWDMVRAVVGWGVVKDHPLRRR